MYITELPFPGIRNIAIQRLAKEYPDRDPEQCTVNDFSWKNTPEGGKFWVIIFIFGKKNGVLPKSRLRYILEVYNKLKNDSKN